MKHIFIVNPVSGKKDAARSFIPAIEAAAASCGADYLIELTHAPKHATQIVRTHAATGRPLRFYAVGGDGTLNEIIDGARAFPNTAVGSIPCGSGNDFVRSFDPIERFFDIPAQLQAESIPLDLIEVDGGVSAAITSAGLDAEVAYGIPRYRRIPLLGGSMAYNISIVEHLLKPLGPQMHIDVDGEVFEGRFLIAAVCNARHYGGGYCAAPMAQLNDGLLDVILVKKVSRLRIASIIGKYKKGEHYQNGAVIPAFQDVMIYRRARQVLIEPGTPPFVINVDGECGPAPRLYAKVLPLAFRFIVPPAKA